MPPPNSSIESVSAALASHRSRGVTLTGTQVSPTPDLVIDGTPEPILKTNKQRVVNPISTSSRVVRASYETNRNSETR